MANRYERNTLLRYEKERRRNILANPGVFDFVLILDHLKPGYNVPKIFRTAEAFGAAGVHLIEIGPFDPSPAKGSFRKVPALFHKTFDSCYQQLNESGYHFFRLAPDATTTCYCCDYPHKSAFILGHEEFGFSFELEKYPLIQSLKIPQFGSVQSLNVSIASAVVISEYVRQHTQKH